MLPTLRPMLPGDVDAATDLILRNDFGVRRDWLAFATTEPECRPVVAEAGGELVGTGVGTANGSVGWVGTVFVAPALRGQGLGRALTQAAIDSLEKAGCETLVLVSTREGLPLYRSLGFEPQARYEIFEATGLDGPADSSVRVYDDGDLSAMTVLDRQATGEDRSHVLRAFANPSSTKVLTGEAGDVRGFVVRAPWGGGATIATTIDDALRILEARRAASGPDGRVRVGLLDANEAGLERLQAEGLRRIWGAPRLVRGRPFEWRPDWIWGQFNHAMG